jgi:uncharacterized RDD family membrane protein YckC
VQTEQQVVTGEAVALELQLAGAGSRCIAALIDFAIVTVVQLLVLFFILVTSWGSGAAILTALIVAEVGITLGYPVAMETLWRGRTLGKAVMGLRVVREDGGPIRFRHAFVRGLVGVAVDKPGISYGLAALIPMLATVRKKRLGDMAAGTIVLQDRVPGSLDAPVAMPPPLAGWAAGLDMSGIDDGFALRMRQFLGRARQLSPPALATIEHQLATEIVARVGPPPANTPGWALISAVLAERRNRAFYATQPPPPPTPPAPWDASAPPAPVGSPSADPARANPATTEPDSVAPDVAARPSGFAPPG